MLLLDELDARGLLANCTDRAGLAELLASHAPIVAYAGYDPTAPSLHVGNLVPSILLKRLQLAGHKPIVVVGGATGMIGDPSGKSEERNLLDAATLATNVAGIRAQLARQLDFDTSTTGASLVNNHDWTVGITYLEFLRDIGKYLTVNYMTAKDSVNSRLQSDNGISYTEFSYMLLKAFDFVHLAESHNCRRCKSAVTISTATSPRAASCSASSADVSCSAGPRRCCSIRTARRWARRRPASGSGSTPRARRRSRSTSTGSTRPMTTRRDACGCSRSNRSRESTSSSPPRDADRTKRLAQRELARVMTGWVHGADAITAIESASGELFGGDLSKLGDTELEAMAGTIPSVDVPRVELEAGIALIDLLVRSGLEDSKGAARRQISQGGASVNNVVITDIAKKVAIADLLTPTRLVLRKGRKHYRIVRAV